MQHILIARIFGFSKSTAHHNIISSINEWKVGSKVEVYSQSHNDWFIGIIININEKDLSIHVKYKTHNNETRSKHIHHNDKMIRPLKKKLLETEVKMDKQIMPISENEEVINFNPKKYWIKTEKIPCKCNQCQMYSEIVFENKETYILKQLMQSIPDIILTDHIQYVLHDTYTINNNNEYIIVTNGKDEFCVPNLDIAINNIENENNKEEKYDIDWKRILYDVYLYCNENMMNMLSFSEQRQNQWNKYLKTYKHRQEMSIERTPTQKIADPILRYHHYTIAVSHVIKHYKIFNSFKLTVIFVINNRVTFEDQQDIDIETILHKNNIPYLQYTLNGNQLNQSIISIFDIFYEYKKHCNDTDINLVFNFDENTHNSNKCTTYIYSQKSVINCHSTTNIQSTILPCMNDNNWRFFILEFNYFHSKYVKCYWKIDGKTLRFFPEHMECIWPKYFLMSEKDINKLIYNHKYRHQFGIGLYDKHFCTLYYAITHTRFLSTHYYRKYEIKNKLSLKHLEIKVQDSEILEGECKQFEIMKDDSICRRDTIHECNRINRLVFMLAKHEHNKLEELCYIFKKCEIFSLDYIEKDIEHLIQFHYCNDFKKVFEHIFSHVIKHENVTECRVKLACWPLRRRTRSIYRVQINQKTDEECDDLLHDEKEFSKDEEKLEIKTMRRMLDHLHCDIFHRDPNKHFRYYWNNDKGQIDTLQKQTLADFERIILTNCDLDELYRNLKKNKLSSNDLEIFKEYIQINGYDIDRIHMIEDIENKIMNNMNEYMLEPYLSNHRDIIVEYVNNNYLNVAAIFRKYRIREEIFVNADKNDIKQLLKEKEHMNIDDNQFEIIYETIMNHEFKYKNEEKKSNEENNNNKFLIYDAENSDEWLTNDYGPQFKCMEEELLNNSYRPILKSHYIDTELECILLHENKKRNIDIMSCQELIALKIFTDYTQLQTAFSMAYYADHTMEKKRKREFWHWNLILKQAMHYAAKPKCKYKNNKYKHENNKLWRGLKGLLFFESFEIMAQQPTSFSLDKNKASNFCGDNGILLEATSAIGIGLSWLSNFEHEDEWWCFNTIIKLDTIHIKTNDSMERVNYFKYSLKNISYTICHKFSFYSTSMKECVFDSLDFEIKEDEKEAEILIISKYNNLTLLQRIFFELKQYYIIGPIWEFEQDDIELCDQYKRLYILKNHIFTNTIHSNEDSIQLNDYCQYIIDSLTKQKCIPSVKEYINQKETNTFVNEIILLSIQQYNNNNNNNNNVEITEQQQKSMVNQLEMEKWTVSKWNEKKAAGVKLKSQVIPKLLGIQQHKKWRIISRRLYTIIEKRIHEPMNKSFDDFKCDNALNIIYDTVIQYKQFDELNSSQLMYILQKHIFPKMDEKSDAISQKEIIINYINKKQLKGKDFLCENANLFSENVIKFSSNDNNNDQHNSFIDILDKSIDEHQKQYYEKTKKKLYYLDKEKILKYFRNANYDCDKFRQIKKTKFVPQILRHKKKLGIPNASANKLYDIINRNVLSIKSFDYTDLYNKINEYKLNVLNKINKNKPKTMIEYKLENINNNTLNAFDALIGEFELEFIDDTKRGPFFQMKLTNEQKNMLINYPPDGKIKLIMYINNVEKDSRVKPQVTNKCTNYSEKIVGSMNTSFEIDISKVIPQPKNLNYVISMNYGKYNLISKVQTIEISKRIIDACKTMDINTIKKKNVKYG